MMPTKKSLLLEYRQTSYTLEKNIYIYIYGKKERKEPVEHSGQGEIGSWLDMGTWEGNWSLH